MKIHVGGLPVSVDDAELKSIFVPYGEVTWAKVEISPRTGKPTGNGDVEMPVEVEARAAVAALNGSIYQGSRLTVRIETR